MSNVAVVNTGASTRKRRYKKYARRYYRKTWNNPRYNVLRVKFETLFELHFPNGDNPDVVAFYPYGRQGGPWTSRQIEDILQLSPAYNDIGLLFGKYKVRGIALDIIPIKRNLDPDSNIVTIPVAIGFNEGVGYDPDAITFSGLLIQNNAKILSVDKPMHMYYSIKHSKVKLFRNSLPADAEGWLITKGDGQQIRNKSLEWLVKISIYATCYNALF